MSALLTVLDANRQLVQFLYGQAFFIAALAIALRVNRESNFRLAKCIWLFAAFAVLHAFSEWGEVFIPLQRTYMPDALIRALEFAQILLVGSSFIVLYEFGASLLARQRPPLGWLRVLTLPVGAAWVTSFVLGSSLLPNFANNLVDLSTALARVLLLLPATALAVTALSIEAADGELAAFPRISHWLRWAAIGLLAWALVAETAPSILEFLSGGALSDLEAPLVTAAIPAGLGLAYCMARAMEIFSIEQRRQMGAMERRHLLLLERERIGQELHDGVTQILYSIGLHSQAGMLRSQDPGAREVFESLSGLARTGLDEVRSAIDSSLPRLEGGHTLQEAIRALPTEYAPTNGPTIEVHCLGPAQPLPAAVEATLYRIAREAFFNACRHGGASHVEVVLEFQDQQVGIRIQDNGIGITEEQRTAALEREASHLGLAGLVQRLAPWHGTLGIHRRPQGGTEVVAIMPLTPRVIPPRIAEDLVQTIGGVA
jgi:signal transduction histidine kinase